MERFDPRHLTSQGDDHDLRDFLAANPELLVIQKQFDERIKHHALPEATPFSTLIIRLLSKLNAPSKKAVTRKKIRKTLPMKRFDTSPPAIEHVEIYRDKLIEPILSKVNYLREGSVERETVRTQRDIDHYLKQAQELRLASSERIFNLMTQQYEEEMRNRKLQWLHIMQGRDRYLKCSFSNFNVSNDRQRLALAKIRKFAEHLETHIDNGVNVILYGPCGTGKDHLMTALMGTVVWKFARMRRIYFYDGAILAARAKADRGKTVSGYYSEDSVREPRVLAISDPVLPGETAKYYQRERLNQLIDEQYRARHPVWITINSSTREEFNEMITPRIADRLRHNAFTLHTDWESFRQLGEFE